MSNIIIRNIDVDPEKLDTIETLLKTQDAGSGTTLLILHQRKSEVLDNERRARLLDSIKMQTSQLLDELPRIDSVYLLDCCSENSCLHSDFDMLTEMLVSISESLSEETEANVLLVDYAMQDDNVNAKSDKNLEIVSLFDPSVFEARALETVIALQETNPSLDLVAVGEMMNAVNKAVFDAFIPSQASSVTAVPTNSGS